MAQVEHNEVRSEHYVFLGRKPESIHRIIIRNNQIEVNWLVDKAGKPLPKGECAAEFYRVHPDGELTFWFCDDDRK